MAGSTGITKALPDEEGLEISLSEPLNQEEFVQFCRNNPDFIIEVRSQPDSQPRLKRKMKDIWMANGVQLAWLIDPKEQKTYIYRADGSEEIIAGFDQQLNGEAVLPGFILDLSLLVG